MTRWRTMIGSRLLAIVAAISTVIGPDELFLGTTLALLTAGLWPRFGQESLVAPAVVLLWVAIPRRAPFIAKDGAPSSKKGT